MRQRANVRLGHECPRLLNSRCPGIESRRYARRVPLSRGNCARRRTAALHFARRIAPAANKSRCVVNSASRLGALGAARQAECTSRSLGCERVMWLLTQQSADNRRPATHGGTAGSVFVALPITRAIVAQAAARSALPWMPNRESCHHNDWHLLCDRPSAPGQRDCATPAFLPWPLRTSLAVLRLPHDDASCALPIYTQMLLFALFVGVRISTLSG